MLFSRSSLVVPLVSAMALLAPFVALADPGVLKSSEGSLILTHTDVHAEVELGLAVVTVSQSFRNPFDIPIDATYIFPLPPEASVRHLTMQCGDRVLEAKIADKVQAREAYEEAKKEGKRAALLEQQHPGLFTQSLAGLCPGETVELTMEYVEPLLTEAGVTDFAFPTTMGSKYDPGPIEEPTKTSDRSVAPGFSLTVDVLGGPLESFWSDSHSIILVGEDELGATIELTDEEVPNQDFHVAWSMAGEEARLSAVAADGGGDAGYVAVTLQPGILRDFRQTKKRELMFVLDASCSMSGQPWETASQTVELALDQMSEEDTFNLVRFSDAAGSLFEAPLPATAENVEQARAWLSRGSGGGTNMMAGIRHSLEMPGDADALRLVLLLTDGFIGNEQNIHDTVTEELPDNARVFGVGIGSSPNRVLLEGLSAAGRGAAMYQLPGTPQRETVARFYDRIAYPAMTDITVDFGGASVSDVMPPVVPDLWAGHALHLVGRFDESVQTTVTVRGMVGDEEVKMTVPLDLSRAQNHEAVSTWWAAEKIDMLRLTARGEEQADAIQDVALEHSIVTEHTSLLVVDDQPGSCGASRGEVGIPLQADAYEARSSGVLGLVGSNGSAFGAGGLGSRGIGVGGGGTAVMGGLGSGKSGYGTGGGSFGAKGSAGATKVGGDPIILGSISKERIDAVIKRHMNQLRYCYERELQQAPKLAGKVVLKFTIAADGSVSAANTKSTTLGSSAVENCLIGRFKRMKFPAPPGGGIAIVSYPFLFSPK